MAKAVLVRHDKRIFKNNLVIEVKIWALESSPYKLKYSFICIDTQSNQRVLFDNHHPKGPHYHIDDKEFEYNYMGVDKLIQDFKKEVQIKFGVKL